MKLLTLFLSALLVAASIPIILGNQEDLLVVQLNEVNSPDRIQRTVVQVSLHCFLETLLCDIEFINSINLSLQFGDFYSGN